MKQIILGSITLTTLLLSGCGGGSSNDGGVTTAPSTVTGTFIDSAVSGLSYNCSSGLSGITNSKGEFSCKNGDTVSFSINGFALGSATAGTTVTPKSLFPSDAAAVTNIAQLLQTLDSDGDVSNGITLDSNSQEYKSLTSTTEVSLTQVDFDSAIASHIGKVLVSESSANAHLQVSLNNINGVDSLESSLNNRTLVYILTSMTQTTCDSVDVRTHSYEGYANYTAFVADGGTALNAYYPSSTKSCSEYSSASKCEVKDYSETLGGSGSCVLATTFPKSSTTTVTPSESQAIEAPQFVSSTTIEPDVYKTDKIDAGVEATLQSFYTQNLSAIQGNSDKTRFVAWFGDDATYKIISIDGTILKSFEGTELSIKAMSDEYIVMENYAGRMEVYDTDANLLWVNSFDIDHARNMLVGDRLYLYNSYNTTVPATKIRQINMNNGDVLQSYTYASEYNQITIFPTADALYLSLGGWDGSGYAIYKSIALNKADMSEKWTLSDERIIGVNSVKNVFYTFGFLDMGSLDDGIVQLEDSLNTQAGVVSAMRVNRDGSFYLQSYNSSENEWVYSLYN